VRRRLGQGGFQAVVLDAYQARRAITGHKIRPTLQAAHIRPITADGPHAITNGLLRSDADTMFDRGYLSVDPSRRLLVSLRLRQELGNGEESNRIAGQPIRAIPANRPARRRVLEWRCVTVFKPADTKPKSPESGLISPAPAPSSPGRSLLAWRILDPPGQSSLSSTRTSGSRSGDSARTSVRLFCIALTSSGAILACRRWLKPS
jgi:hypothetical protein